MPVQIALLRGINVVGNNRIRMEALKAIFESLGLKNVRTYIQSGNVVFEGPQKGIAAKIEAAIEAAAGFRPAVIIRTPAQLREVAAANPFTAEAAAEPAKMHVFFLDATPTPSACATVEALNTGPERLHFAGSELFIFFPTGIGQSKFPFARLDRLLKTPATARNWNTLLKLIELSG